MVTIIQNACQLSPSANSSIVSAQVHCEPQSLQPTSDKLEDAEVEKAKLDESVEIKEGNNNDQNQSVSVKKATESKELIGRNLSGTISTASSTQNQLDNSTASSSSTTETEISSANSSSISTSVDELDSPKASTSKSISVSSPVVGAATESELQTKLTEERFTAHHKPLNKVIFRLLKN